LLRLEVCCYYRYAPHWLLHSFPTRRSSDLVVWSVLRQKVWGFPIGNIVAIATCIHFRAKTAWIPEVQEVLLTHAMHSRTKLDACAVLHQQICGAPQLVGSVEPIRIMMDAAGNVGSVQNDSQVVRLLVRGD